MQARIYIYIFFSSPFPFYFLFPLFHRLRSDLRFKLLYASNREILATAKAREMCVAKMWCITFSFTSPSRTPIGRSRNLMFFSSLPEKRESFPRFSPSPPPHYLPFASSQSRQRFNSIFLSFQSCLFFFLLILGLERRKENPSPLFFLNFSRPIFLILINWHFLITTQIQQRSILCNVIIFLKGLKKEKSSSFSIDANIFIK